MTVGLARLPIREHSIERPSAGSVRRGGQDPFGSSRIRYFRVVRGCRSPRDKALALVPFYAGARIAETVALDVDDVRLSARKGILRIYGKRERVREVPVHPELRKALTDWLRGAATGRERKTAPRCFSTSAATG